MAAVLAFASTPSLAQDPSAPFPTAPEQVIVVPDIPVPAPAPVPESATVQPIETPANPPAADTIETPEPTTTSAPAATTSRPRATPSAARITPEPEPRVAAPEPVAIEAAPVAAATTIEPVAEPAPPATASEPLRGNANDDIGIVALVLGGLAFLALAIWGFVAIGRRKPVRRYVAETPAVTPATAAPVAVERPVTSESPLRGPSFTPRPIAASGALSHTGAAVALPRSLPENFDEREALFRRMVDARPDRANPFTDRKARMKRARLILQSLGRDFGDAEPWIDLSQYPQNWPELAHKRSAAA